MNNTTHCRNKLHLWVPANITSENGKNRCLECRRLRQRERFKANPEKVRAWGRAFHKRHREKRIQNSGIYQLKKLYGITLVQYQELFDKQNGCCAICERPQSKFTKKLSVDHNHETGKVRGLLCGTCNAQIVGVIENPLLGKALEYLNLSGVFYAKAA